jgi:hypothetical protein
MSKPIVVNMKAWKGVPVGEWERDKWMRDMLSHLPPGKGDHAITMSGDSMVLITWDNDREEWCIYDMKVKRVGYAK